MFLIVNIKVTLKVLLIFCLNNLLIAKMNSCVCCKKSFKSNLRNSKQRGVLNSSSVIIAKKLFGNSNLEIGGRICNKCRLKLARTELVDKETSCDSSNCSTYSTDIKPTKSKTVSNDDIFIEIEIPRCTLSQKMCIVCGSKKTRKRVPELLRLNTYIKRQFYIPRNVRCCITHYLNNNFYDNTFLQIRQIDNTSLISGNELKWLLASSGKMCRKSDIMMSFKLNDITDNDCYSITGLHHEQFDELLSKLPTLRNSPVRTKSEALAIFLSRLRHNISYDALSSFLSFTNAKQIENICNEVEKALVQDIVPYFIGCECLTRHKLIQRQTVIATQLFSTDVVLKADGTYAYHQKSKNNLYQRKSYNVHKHANLCKPFTMCTSDGYIIDFFGPYEGTVNDATIMKHVLSTNGDLLKVLERGDVFVLDRGFRDSIQFIEDMGFGAKMPCSLSKNGKQLTEKQANDSRIVTKVRWVVEAIHGILKQKWKMLGSEIKNQSLPKVKNYFLIAGALHNMYGKVMESDKGQESDVIKKMTESSNNNFSKFHAEVESKYLKKKCSYKNFNINICPDFPVLSDAELKFFCLGSYQMTQAISYLTEHHDGKQFSFKFCFPDKNVLLAKIQSRHVSQREYKILVKYNPESSGIESIIGHYCSCKSGLRTLGCCAHIGAIVLLLSHMSYDSAEFNPAKKIHSLFSDGKIVIPDDSEDDSI